MSEFKFSKRSLKHMEGVDESLQSVALLAIQITKVDFGIPPTGGLRTVQMQRELFDAKKSNADGEIHKSKHQFGNALDVYAYVDGKASWDHGHLAQVAAAFLQASILLQIPIRWGGLWKTFLDMPHFELAEIRSDSSREKSMNMQKALREAHD